MYFELNYSLDKLHNILSLLVLITIYHFHLNTIIITAFLVILASVLPWLDGWECSIPVIHACKSGNFLLFLLTPFYHSARHAYILVSLSSSLSLSHREYLSKLLHQSDRSLSSKPHLSNSTRPSLSSSFCLCVSCFFLMSSWAEETSEPEDHAGVRQTERRTFH